MVRVETDEQKRTREAREAATRLLVTYLRSAAVGEIIPYAVLAQRSGWPLLDPKERTPIHRARSIILREDRIRYACVTGVGVKRMADVEVVADGPSAVSRARRKIRNERRKVEAIQHPDKLSSEDLSKVFMHSAILGTMEQATRPREVRRMTTRDTKSLPTPADLHEQMLQIFKKPKRP